MPAACFYLLSLAHNSAAQLNAFKPLDEPYGKTEKTSIASNQNEVVRDKQPGRTRKLETKSKKYRDLEDRETIKDHLLRKRRE